MNVTTTGSLEILTGKKAGLVPESPGEKPGDLKTAPVSFAQQRLWFLDQMFPENAAYNMPLRISLEGRLAVAALERALNEIVRRHENLRTTFGQVEGRPVQRIAPVLKIQVPQIDLSSGSPTRREEEMDRLAREEAMRPFDLARGPLLRATLLRLAETKHVLLLTLHHIAGDGWSFGVLFQELAALYEAFVKGRLSPLPELPIQYADFATWQRQWLQGEVLERQLQYWTRQFQDAEPLQLPTDRPRSSLPSFRGASQRRILPKPLADDLKTLSRREGATLFMTLLTAFQCLLHRLTGQEDIIVGTPIANRNRREIEPLIGFFVNNLGLRTRVTGEDTMLEVLRRVREVTIEAYDHQDLPFERLVEALKPERDVSRHPLFQITFALQNTLSQHTWELPELRASLLKGKTELTRFDLEIHIEEQSNGLGVGFVYNTDLLEAETVSRWLQLYERVLEAMAIDPGGRVKDLRLLSDQERNQLLVEWNQTAQEVPGSCMHELFEEQVKRTPDSVAAVFGDQSIRYEQLNRQASQLACYLRKWGAGPDVTVGLCVERSIDLIVGVLGILKAGAAYVPLDPSYPKERLEFMLRDSGAPILLTQQRLLDRFPASAARVICMDRDSDVIGQEPENNVSSGVTHGNLAYVIYTSGSTGQPKGVMVAHQGLVNYLVWATQAYRVAAGPGAPVHSSISFDLTVTGLFTPLLAGGTVCLLPEEQKGIDGLCRTLSHHLNYSLVKITPAHLEILSRELAPKDAANGTRTFVIGGENLVGESLAFWQAHAPDTVLINEYGPTETVVGCCVYQVPRGTPLRGSVPIGRPIANTRLYVLDRYQQPVPLGVYGELYIGGHGVARGYWNRPELTAEKFIQDPFSTDPAARLYRSGDVVRYRADGNLEFLGRMDDQVKIRGFRIELGEIHAVLEQRADVKQCTVIVREDRPGDRRLVAYVVLKSQTGERLEDLRGYLQEKLPDYMVPSTFVFLEKLPLTPNGKVDRQALPAPSGERSTAREYVAPQTELEQCITRIWAEVLGVDKVGRQDNFFDAGGHSLLLVVVHGRLQKELGRQFSVVELFQYATVEALARHLAKPDRVEPAMARLDQTGQDGRLPRRSGQAQGGVGRGSEEPLKTMSTLATDRAGFSPAAKPDPAAASPGDKSGTLKIAPVSFAQQRLWFLDQMFPGNAAYNMPLRVSLEGPLAVAALERALNEIVRRHENLRTTFGQVEGRPVQRIAPVLKIQVPQIDLSSGSPTRREEEMNRLAREEAMRPFDLAQGPLLRATLLRLAETKHVLLLTLHHIAGDGWSFAVLFQELAALYEAFVKGQRSPLAELPIQYADFAIGQRQWLQGEVLERQLRYWTQQLQGAEPLQLPTDRSRPLLSSSRGAYQQRSMPKRLLDGLRGLGQRESSTLFMTLVAAFQCLLHRLTGQEDIIVGTLIANRNRREIESLIGFFVNNLSLRTPVSGAESFLDVLRDVRKVVLEAYDHQDLPFERLVEELKPERDVSRHPLFQVMFALQNTPMQREWKWPELQVSLLRGQTEFTRFDLEVHVQEQPEGLEVALVYNTDLFDAATVSRWVQYYERMLRGIVANPQCPVNKLPLLDEAERTLVLEKWNRTEQAFPAVCVHQLVEEQVRRSPETVAVVFGEQSLSYAQLNGRANQLAHKLQKCGVGPDVLVGVCMERSLDLVVSLLGILKAGGAYVPLDPAYPRERLEFMLRDSQAPVLLTQRALQERLAGTGAQVLCLDSDWEAIAAESAENPVSATRPEHLAYVIYTSGSTGRPKGVAIEHRNTVALLQWARTTYSAEELSGVLASTSICFDLSVFEMFVPLSWGGRVILVENVLQLLSLPATQEVTLINTVPSAIAELLRANGIPRSVRTINLAGEPLTQHLADQLYALPGMQKVYDLYGPSEDTTYSTCALRSSGGPATIGRPIANTQTYILDSRLQPVPLGVPGELCLSGAGLARGYLNQPELTAEKFVRHPFGADPKARLYRTGDLARYRPDGNIEFLGRIDHQVKVRGFRIELGEIESVLARREEVQECAVIVREEQPGDKQLVGYVVPRPGCTVSSEELRSHLKGALPDFMLPSAFVLLHKLPLTPSGKVDRRALPAPTGERKREATYLPPQSELEDQIARIWAEFLQIERVGRQDNFFDLGGHSLLLVRVHTRLQKELGRELSVVQLFQYPTVESLARHLGQRVQEEPALNVRAPERVEEQAIAVIGMAGRFPGAATPEKFWENLRDGVESISFFSAEELEAVGLDRDLVRRPDYVRAKGALEGADLFDAGFFGYSPREAEIIDPQQRVFLECAWEALERAGYDPQCFPGRIGLYAGVGFNSYWEQLRANPELCESVGGFQLAISNDKDHLPTRVSYKLNLQGPSVSVQTACSTSLVAVHLACQSLRYGEADMALAGGVTITAQAKGGYVYIEEGIASPDGHCRPFDEQSQGTVAGSGAGLVVLKRLSEALRDGDVIHAVIRGSAINNDGSSKVGYTAPGVTGQAEVIRAAQAQAGVSPETIGYLEAHGTATPLGDPIEIEALTQAFRAGGARQNGFCAIGSVKSNVGHLDTAAGVAGLIKAALALQHRQIPASLHFHQPNPKIDFANSPFYVNGRLQHWEGASGLRRAGVSSFGIGGTNAHVVLEEAPAQKSSGPSRPWQLLVTSARTPAALERVGANLRRHLEGDSAVSLADVAFTLQRGRKAFAHRRIVVCRERAGAIGALQQPDQCFSGKAEGSDRPVVFLFSGQGSQYPGMGRELHEAERVYREAVDQCAEWLQPHLGLDLRTVIHPAEADGSAARLNQTALTQPALFVMEWALAKLWRSWGVRPAAMIGHSIGEYVAATVAGVFRLEDALRLVAARGRLMQSMPPGSMLGVSLSAGEVEDLLREQGANAGWSLAAINAPRSCVVSGPSAAIEHLGQVLSERRVSCRRLQTSHAFHSAMLDPMLAEFLAEVKQVPLSPPGLPFLSNVTGTWIHADQATDPEYWMRQIRQPVRFSEGIQELLKEPARVFVEAGPGNVLSQLTRQHLAQGNTVTIVNSLRHPQETMADQAQMLTGLGRLWVAGVKVDWEGFSAQERRQRVVLPTYPFERQRYWVEARPAMSRRSQAVRKGSDVSEWFYLPAWKRVSLPAPLPAHGLTERPQRWLLFVDESGVGTGLARELKAKGQEVITVVPGEQFARKAPDSFTVNPRSCEDYDALCEALRATEALPNRIVHLWSVNVQRSTLDVPPVDDESFEREQWQGFYSLLFLTQALAQAHFTEPLRIEVITNQLHAVNDGERLRPEKATLLGLCKVIPQEYANVTCRSIDLGPCAVAMDQEPVVAQLLQELAAPSSDLVVAYRGRHRWAQVFESLRWPASNGSSGRLRPGAVCLITGGLGGVGLVLAEYLARTVQAKLVLIGRSAFPDRKDWSHWLETHTEEDQTSRRIRRLLALEELGAEILVMSADAADVMQMTAAVTEAERRFGPIHGVIHAAGLGKSIPLQDTTLADCAAQFRAKVHGLLALEKALGDRPLDFRLMTSSLASLLGGLGFAAYAAANQFMDAFAQERDHTGQAPWTSVNWDGWDLVPSKRGQGRPAGAVAALALNPSEGADAFARVLSMRGVAQVAVSTGNLSARMEQWLKKEPVPAAPLSKAGEGRLAAEPATGTKNRAAPQGDIEQIIAEVWQQALGVPAVSVHDNFFELGGNSLVAVQMLPRLREAFQIALPVHALFDAPTVAQLAKAIEQARASTPAELDRIEELLTLVEQTSETELKALLSQEPNDPTTPQSR